MFLGFGLLLNTVVNISKKKLILQNAPHRSYYQSIIFCYFVLSVYSLKVTELDCA